MKNLILFLLSFVFSNIYAQTKFRTVPVVQYESSLTTEEYEMIKSVLNQKKSIHIHPDAKKKNFLLCWEGEKTKFEIIGPNGKIIKKGRININKNISTKRWKSGVYTIKINNVVEYLFLVRK